MIKISNNVSLAPYTTFKVGGPARRFVAVKSLTELHEALVRARHQHWPIFVLAGGSNLIVANSGFPGLVVLVQFGGIKIIAQKIIAGAATPMKVLVDASIAKGLAGLEWAGGLPGSFGGAIRGNAGAFGGEIKDTIDRVTSVNRHTGSIKHWNQTDCQFEYRGSLFKRQPDEIIIIATLQLRPGEQRQLRQTADSHISYRQQKHPLEYPNAGSIFKNTPVKKIPAPILKQWQDVIKVDPFPVVPTAKIIADAGLKGLRVGDAQLSEKHTNYVVNLGAATGEDIVAVIKKIQTVVQEKFGIELEIEPELVGF